MKILITGIPGTGKTTIGHRLANAFAFRHFDMEGQKPDSDFDKMLNDFDQLDGDKVITWGFMPGEHDNIVQQFISNGYKMVWFDGNRNAARASFIKRGTVSVKALNDQMDRIDGMDLNNFKPIIFNTFKPDGLYKKVDDICRELIKLCEG